MRLLDLHVFSIFLVDSHQLVLCLVELKDQTLTILFLGLLVAFQDLLDFLFLLSVLPLLPIGLDHGPFLQLIFLLFDCLHLCEVLAAFLLLLFFVGFLCVKVEEYVPGFVEFLVPFSPPLNDAIASPTPGTPRTLDVSARLSSNDVHSPMI